MTVSYILFVFNAGNKNINLAILHLAVLITTFSSGYYTTKTY